MRYIEREDLTTVIQGRLLDESIAEAPADILDKLEYSAIVFVWSYISGRYDCPKIFGSPVLRHELLVQVMSMIVCYRVVRRNAARKVPDDYLALYREALEILANIQKGSQRLNGLPEITGESGTSGSLMYGSNRNPDFFI